MRSRGKISESLLLAVAILCFIVPAGARGDATQHAQEHVLRLYNTHTGERLEIVFRRGEQYIPGALAKLDIGTSGVIVTAPGEGDMDYVCRFFAPSIGIDEDPATGSIHCTLAPYWAGQLGKDRLRARQLSVRGGSMQCAMSGDRVKIAGSARLYLHGTLEL